MPLRDRYIDQNRLFTPYTLSMPGDAPLATCTLPVEARFTYFSITNVITYTFFSTLKVDQNRKSESPNAKSRRIRNHDPNQTSATT